MIIDISSYQTVTDWTKIKTTIGLEGMYIKACEGINAPDKGFNDKAKGASDNQIPFGFYHFATLNKTDVETDASSEANYFFNLTKNFKTTLPLVLDIEKNDLKLPPDKVSSYIHYFFNTLKSLGVSDYMLYSYTPFLNANLPSNHDLGVVKLWLAAYTNKPIYPKGWDKIELWQYSQSGFINGISGNVDLSKKII